MRVLITGAGGAIGRVVLNHLAGRGHAVVGFDRSPGSGTWFTGSLQDAALVDRAMAGCEAVVHLAATPDRADFLSDLLPNNVAGTYQVLTAAVAHGVKRVVMASTLRVVALHRQRQDPIGEDEEPRPHDDYSLSKVLCEDMASYFHHRHNLSIVCARIGWFIRNAQEAAKAREYFARPESRAAYLSYDDCRSFFAAALETETVGCERCFVISHNGGQTRYRCEVASRTLGWTAKDSFPEGSPAELFGAA